jgi:hypothetical protein
MGTRYTQNNFYITDDEALDARQGPFNSVSEALDFIEHRYKGLSVYVLSSGSVVEYWFKNGIADGDLVIKTASGSASTVFQNEIHVSKDGNDTTGDGTLLKPFLTITQGLTLVVLGGTRKTIILHPGSYSESPNITVQYTVLATFELLGGNTEIVGTVSTNKGCTISGIKMNNLTITAPAGTGNVNILNCEISGTLTKSSNTDYTLIRLCDYGAANITGGGLVAIFSGNPNFTTINNATANVIIKSSVTVAPVLTAGTLTLADSIVVAAVTNAFTSAAGTFTTLANSQFLTSALNNVAPIVLNGFYSILNCVFDKPTSTLVAFSGTGGSTNSIVYSQYINADKFIKQGGTTSQFLKANGDVDSTTYQPLLTNPVTGTGTNNEIAVFNSTGSTITSLSTATYPSLTEFSYVKGVTSAIQTQINTFPRVVYTDYTAETTTSTTTTNALTTFSLTIADADWPLGGVLRLSGLMERTAGSGSIFMGLVCNSSTARYIAATGQNMQWEWQIMKEAASTLRIGMGPSSTGSGSYAVHNQSTVTATASSGNYVFTFYMFVGTTGSTASMRWMKGLIIP